MNFQKRIKLHKTALNKTLSNKNENIIKVIDPSNTFNFNYRETNKQTKNFPGISIQYNF